MQDGGSYTLASFAVDTGAEVRRLNAQVDLFWNQEHALYATLGMRNGMRVLDCGCGPGYLVQKLAALFPDSTFTGVDVDPELVRIASAAHANGDACNRAFLCQSLLDLEFEEGSFDFVISRLVLEHLPEPDRALGEVLRVLRTGGTAVFVDNDFAFHERTWPDCPALRDYYDAYRRARTDDGGNPCIGRHLPHLLKHAGFADVRLDLISAHSQFLGDEPFFKASGIGIPAQLHKDGYLKEHTLESLTEQWAEMLAQPNHSVFRILFAASGKKPENVSAGTETSSGAATEQEIPARGNGDLTFLRTSPEAIKRFVTEILEADMETPPNSLPPDEPLVALGVDSVAALRLCNRLKGDFGVGLKISDVISGKSIDEITRDVLQQLEESQGSPSAPIQARPRTARVSG